MVIHTHSHMYILLSCYFILNACGLQYSATCSPFKSIISQYYENTLMVQKILNKHRECSIDSRVGRSNVIFTNILCTLYRTTQILITYLDLFSEFFTVGRLSCIKTYRYVTVPSQLLTQKQRQNVVHAIFSIVQFVSQYENKYPIACHSLKRPIRPPE